MGHSYCSMGRALRRNFSIGIARRSHAITLGNHILTVRPPSILCMAQTEPDSTCPSDVVAILEEFDPDMARWHDAVVAFMWNANHRLEMARYAERLTTALARARAQNVLNQEKNLAIQRFLNRFNRLSNRMPDFVIPSRDQNSERWFVDPANELVRIMNTEIIPLFISPQELS